MLRIISAPFRKLKKYVAGNRRLYLIASLVVLMGIVMGIYLALSEYVDDTIYTTIDLDLSEIILGSYSGMKLFWMNAKVLILPLFIIFVLYTNRYTFFLSFFYLGFQGLLLGASITSVVGEMGLAGLINSILIILPINLINFFVMVSFLVISHCRLITARAQRLSFAHSLRLFAREYLGCLAGVVIASVVYGFIYPLLLRTSVVASV